MKEGHCQESSLGTGGPITDGERPMPRRRPSPPSALGTCEARAGAVGTQGLAEDPCPGSHNSLGGPSGHPCHGVVWLTRNGA